MSFAWRDWRRVRITSVRTAEILTVDLLYRKQMCYALHWDGLCCQSWNNSALEWPVACLYMYYFICRDLKLKIRGISSPVNLLTLTFRLGPSALPLIHSECRGMCHCPVLTKQLLAVILDLAYIRLNILNNISFAENTVAKNYLHFMLLLLLLVVVVMIFYLPICIIEPGVSCATCRFVRE
jgi:hypothetical protein